MTGDWEGWEFTARVNPPIRVFGAIASGQFDNIIAGLADILVSWNFVDENGDAMPPPSKESVGGLTTDLMSAVANRYVEELATVPPA